MITTEKVYKLISTLDGAEKKYFRQVVARQEGAEPQYMHLFNLMVESISRDASGEFVFELDEPALIARLKRKKVPETQFHVVRYNLVQTLFRTMRMMHEENNEEDTIKIQLKNSKVLERRGLLDWALEMTEEALEAAERYQYNALAVQALTNLLYLRSHRDNRGYAEKINAHVQQIEANAGKYLNETQMFGLWHQSFALYRTKKEALSSDVHLAIDQLLKCLEAARPAADGSLLARTYFFQSKAVLADLQGGSKTAQPWFAQIMELWEAAENEHLRKEHPRLYLIHLANYLTFSLSIKDFAAYDQYYKVLENFKSNNSDLEAEIFQNRVFLRQLYCLNKGMFKEAADLVPTIERGLKKYAFKINKSRLFLIRYHIILSYFFLYRYDQALQHCETLLRYGKSEQRRDVQVFTNIIRQIAHLELDEFDALERFLKSVRNNLGDEKFVLDFERIALRNLADLAKLHLKLPLNSRERKDALQPVWLRFREELETFRDSKPPYLPLGFEETMLWIKSKITGRPFSDLMRDE